ncbi:hypothetical protein [Cognatishimia sp. F0-27]|uniref:hypothetical protein n=1 Tax=Cognatishimia sp. F0-27 TaxID=2816855 RepID=UPI001D0C16BC|nr:hypothetical protein [Cognatishimia sp. F0-27]
MDAPTDFGIAAGMPGDRSGRGRRGYGADMASIVRHGRTMSQLEFTVIVDLRS